MGTTIQQIPVVVHVAGDPLFTAPCVRDALRQLPKRPPDGTEIRDERTGALILRAVAGDDEIARWRLAGSREPMSEV